MLRDENKIYIRKEGYKPSDGESITRLPKVGEDKEALEVRHIISSLTNKINFMRKHMNTKDYSYTQEDLEKDQAELKLWKEYYKELIEEAPRSHKLLKRKVKKKKDEVVEEEILDIIEKAKNYNIKNITKEDIAIELQVKESQIEKIFMKLNRDGILSQPIHRAPHDSCRDPWGFDNCKMWCSDIYRIL